MAKSDAKIDRIFEELVEKKVGEIRRYRNLINALVACYGYFNNKKDYNCFLGSQIDDLSPDVVVKTQVKEKRDIIGDGKKGLSAAPKKNQNESWDDYEKRQDFIIYRDKILEQINRDINKYSVKLGTISEPHDFFVLCPTEKRMAIKLLEKRNKLDNKLIILSFDFSNDETKYVLRIVKERGVFFDTDINNDFELNDGIFHSMQDFAELMSKYKLYIAEKEDNNAPIEWVMFVIWQYILPELAETNKKEMIIAKLNEGYSIIEVTLKQISDFIKSNYKLPTYNGEKELISYGVIKKAMEHFSSLTRVKVIDGENTSNPKYRVVWSKLSTPTLLHEFVRIVHGENFMKIAKEMSDEADVPKLAQNQITIQEALNKQTLIDKLP